MAIDLTSPIKTVELKLQQFGYAQLFDDQQLQYVFRDCSLGTERHSDWAAHMVHAVCRIFTQELEDVTVSYPADWWSHFKVRFFPTWLLRRYPAAMEKCHYRAEAYYPELALPRDSDPVRFIQKRDTVRYQWPYPHTAASPLDDYMPNSEFHRG